VPITTTIRGLSTEVHVDVTNGLSGPSVVSCDNVTKIPTEALRDQIGVLLDAGAATQSGNTSGLRSRLSTSRRILCCRGCSDHDSQIKIELPFADAEFVSSDPALPTLPGPVADRLTVWPVDDGRYGLDATFQGVSGYERAQWHRDRLGSVSHSFRQELDGAWTLRFGPLPGADVARALAAFVH
jgi:hypothetical protein